MPKGKTATENHVGVCAPGHVRVKRIELGNEVSQGGLLLVKKKDQCLYLHVGEVIACGQYGDQLGKLHTDNVQDWPLPPGTLVEFKNQCPWLGMNSEEVVQSRDVTHWWLPEEWPEWATLGASVEE